MNNYKIVVILGKAYNPNNQGSFSTYITKHYVR